MSAAHARRFTIAGTLSLALVLASPVAALADRGDDGPRDDGRGDARSEQAQNRPADSRKDVTPGSATGAEQREAGTEGSHPAQGKKGNAPVDSARPAGGDDPRGNNGTVKIDGEAFDDGRGNEPHVGCVFQVDFYGFDAGDTAGITFTGQAPTGGGLLHSETATPISDDAAGGGQDRDMTLTYSVDEQLSELLAVTPHPQQGWHVKLEVDVDRAPGGAKSKVFWIDCPQPAGLGGTTTEPATGEAVLDAEQTTDTPLTVAGTHVATFGESEAVVAQTDSAVAGTTLAAAERQDELTLGAAEAETVSASGSRLPSTLAFTGVEGLAALLVLGLVAVGAGAAAHRLGRRTAADELG